HRDLHSFPTRRSSDLPMPPLETVGGLKQLVASNFDLAPSVSGWRSLSFFDLPNAGTDRCNKCFGLGHFTSSGFNFRRTISRNSRSEEHTSELQSLRHL